MTIYFYEKDGKCEVFGRVHEIKEMNETIIYTTRQTGEDLSKKTISKNKIANIVAIPDNLENEYRDKEKKKWKQIKIF